MAEVKTYAELQAANATPDEEDPESHSESSLEEDELEHFASQLKFEMEKDIWTYSFVSVLTGKGQIIKLVYPVIMVFTIWLLQGFMIHTVQRYCDHKLSLVKQTMQTIPTPTYPNRVGILDGVWGP